MKFSVEKTRLNDVAQECLILFAYGEEKKEKDKSVTKLQWEKSVAGLENILSDLEKKKLFSGKKEEIVFLRNHPFGKTAHLLFVGLGKKEDVTLEILRRGLGKAARRLRQEKVGNAAVFLPSLKRNSWSWGKGGQSVTEAFILSLYEFKQFKTKDEPSFEMDHISVVTEEKNLSTVKGGVARGEILAKAQCLARDLQNTPANELTPEKLAERAREVAKDAHLKVTILDETQIRKEKMGALIAVSQGSTRPPRFIVLEYVPAGKAKKTIALVGKGVTFDSGGISLKPSLQMEDMKYDMSGAAAVISAIKAIAELKLPLHVVAIAPATENVPSGTAILPSSVVTAMSGKTIEIDNTDAEGRLILADALHYAGQYQPDVIVDIATLTGACSVALGRACCAAIGTDEKLIAKFHQLGEEVGERVWPLPLYDEYSEDVKSHVADVCNAGKVRGGGASQGAAFLKHFVPEGVSSWVHLDIAGVAYYTSGDLSSYVPRGGTGFGVRLLAEFAASLV
ncbi:MAG: leucyl aminopeptidase [Deltaproteobacteria bacterium]|nr:leucyl aminopeptidase [Deltaproteobacteria bacterium]